LQYLQYVARKAPSLRFFERPIMISRDALERALPSIVGFITDKTGIPVKRGHRACTDGVTVFYPKLAELLLTTRDVVRIIAYIYHECFHILWTNFLLKLGELPPLQLAVVQVLEDVRIEAKGQARFAAARKYLAKMVKILTEDGMAGAKSGFPAFSEDASEAALLQFYMLYKLRHDVLQQTDIAPALVPTESSARKKFPRSMMVRLDALMFEVVRCESTDDVFSLAEEIAVMIKEEKEKEEERKQQDQQDQQQDPQDQSASSDESGSGDDDQQASGSEAGESDGSADTTSTASGQDSDDEGDTSASGTDNEDDGLQQQSADSADADEETKSTAGQSGDDAGGSGNLDELLSMGSDDVAQTIDEMLESAINGTADALQGQGVTMPSAHKLQLPTGEADTTQIRASINAVRTKTLQWMSSKKAANISHSREGVRLDFSRLHLARLGGDVFYRKEDGIDLNAAVSIVIDRSISMAGTIKAAARASLAAMLAFDVPGIKTQVSVFPVYGDDGTGGLDEGVAVIKRWEESSRQLAARIGSLTVDGSTPMAEAILFAAADIVHRRETLRLIVVVTDGEPNDEASTKETIQIARRAGITVVGLGIGVDPTAVFGEKYAAPLHNVTELSGALVKLVKTSMHH
jgi:nitric oxide reductase activation protein